jgi:hypothetical protein
MLAFLTAGRFIKMPRSRANSARGGPDDEAMIELALQGPSSTELNLAFQQFLGHAEIQ